MEESAQEYQMVGAKKYGLWETMRKQQGCRAGVSEEATFHTGCGARRKKGGHEQI